MSGAPAPVRLFYADARNIGANEHEALLAADDLECLAALGHPRRRAQYLAARTLLRFALERSTGRPALAVRLRTASGGKPVCVDGPEVSVSHDGDLIACAVSTAGPIGVDVQSSVPRPSAHAIARQYFAEDEAEWLESGEPRRFYMLWVLKEAYLKARGEGLAGGLDALRCRIAPPVIEARVAAPSPTSMMPPSLALFACGGAYLGLAAEGYPLADVAVEHWNPVSPAAPPRAALEWIAGSA